MRVVYPDYDRSILSITHACLRHFGADARYPVLPEIASLLETGPRHVMLLLLDGMGKFPLERALGPESYLRGHAVADVTSIFPPTTAAATTSYYCGLSAYESGWLGWHLHMKEYATDVVTFQKSAYYTEKPVDGPHPSATLMPYASVFDRVKKAAPEVKLRTICGFDSYSEKGADEKLRAHTFDEVCRHLEAIARQPEKSFTIAYWNQPDAAMHQFGMESDEARRQFRQLDAKLSALSGRLKDALMIVTSDHGMIDTTQFVDVAKIPELLETLVLPPTIEPRASAFYVKPHRLRAFEAAFTAHCGDDFLLLPREEVYRSGIFGRGRPHPKFDDYIGDYLACATGTRYFAFSIPEHGPFTDLKGQHAGLTEQEMLVTVCADRIP